MLSIRKLKVMEGRPHGRRLCGDEEFGSRLLMAGGIGIRENGVGLSDGKTCPSQGLVAGKNRVEVRPTGKENCC